MATKDQVTLVWRTDVHMADTSPQSRTDNWTDTILGKLVQVGQIAADCKADAVIDGGDFFHLKSPSRNSHELVRRVAEVHAGYPCPTYANIGNHDLKYGSFEFLPESPLAVLYQSKIFQRLYDEHEAVFEASGVKVRVVGIPYHGTKYDMNRFTTLVKGDEDYLVAVAHCLASPTGGTMFEAEDVIKYADLANLAPDVFSFGHWHKDQGITEIARNKWVVNVGSLSRGSLSQDDVERTPSCVVMKFSKQQGIELEKVPLQVAPVTAVFNLEGRARKESRSDAMDQVIDRLKGSLKMRDSESVFDSIRTLDLESQIKERAIHYLEKVGAK